MKPEPISPRYLDLDQAGVYLGYGPGKSESVRWMCRNGVFPHIKIGARVFVDKEDIDRVMKENKIAA
jgi:hypothetical protein